MHMLNSVLFYSQFRSWSAASGGDAEPSCDSTRRVRLCGYASAATRQRYVRGASVVVVDNILRDRAASYASDCSEATSK